MAQEDPNEYDPNNKRTWGYAKSDYQHSNFRKILKQFPKNLVTEDAIKSGLYKNKQKWGQLWDELTKKYATESIGVRCVKMYSHASGFYADLNRAILTDDGTALEQYMPFIRGFNLHVSNHATSKEMFVFRKSKLSGNGLSVYKNKMKKGTILRHPMVVSASKSVSVAINWSGPTMIKYIIPKGCLNARDIENISELKHEKEVVLPAYTAVEFVEFKNEMTKEDCKGSASTIKVDGIDSVNENKMKSYPLIVLKVLDNYIVSIQEKKGLLISKIDETHEFEDVMYYLKKLRKCDTFSQYHNLGSEEQKMIESMTQCIKTGFDKMISNYRGYCFTSIDSKKYKKCKFKMNNKKDIHVPYTNENEYLQSDVFDKELTQYILDSSLTDNREYLDLANKHLPLLTKLFIEVLPQHEAVKEHGVIASSYQSMRGDYSDYDYGQAEFAQGAAPTISMPTTNYLLNESFHAGHSGNNLFFQYPKFIDVGRRDDFPGIPHSRCVGVTPSASGVKESNRPFKHQNGFR